MFMNIRRLVFVHFLRLDLESLNMLKCIVNLIISGSGRTIMTSLPGGGYRLVGNLVK